MESTDALFSLLAMVEAEERHCFNAIHWQPSLVPAQFEGKNVDALDWSGKPGPAEITSMMCGTFTIAWDTAFIASPEFRERLRQLKTDRSEMLSKTHEYLRTEDQDVLQQAKKATSAVGLLSFQMKHEHKLLQCKSESKLQSEPVGDGPILQGVYRYKTKRVEGIQPQPWRLLKFMNDKPEADVTDAYRYACGDHAADHTESAIKGMLYKANIALTEAAFPKMLSHQKRTSKLIWK